MKIKLINVNLIFKLIIKYNNKRIIKTKLIQFYRNKKFCKIKLKQNRFLY